MKDIVKSIQTEHVNNELELSCGNCWGHQEYSEQYVKKSLDVARGKKDHFISRFVKKYLRNSK